MMLNPPKKQLINPDDLFGSRELRFQDRRESHYPHLMRLCADFNFSVLQLQRKIFSHLSHKLVPSSLEFVLALRDDETTYWYSLTPGTENLKQLENYCKTFEIDLLHMHLIGEQDTDLEIPREAFF